MSYKLRTQNKLLSCLAIACGGSLTFGGINLYKGNDRFYRELFMPIVHRLTDAETAHKVAINLAKHGFVPKLQFDDNLIPILKSHLFGLEFPNPIGLAAGFDKNGESIKGLSKLGFGFIEIGSVTPQPQPGNDRPRVFRLLTDRAIINRYGFNSAGHEVVKNNVQKIAQNKGKVIIGLNLGKNKSTEDMTEDYIKGILMFCDLESIDYMVINISSPNTPHLRQLQNKKELKELIERVLKVRNDKNIEKPLLLKIAPDLNGQQLAEMADIINKFVTNKSNPKGIDGLIVTNTTVDRPIDLKSDKSVVAETGGLSGLPLKDKSTEVIRQMYKLTKGNVPIIGVGGVFTGEDAYDKIKAGASLIQIYTSLTFEGPQIAEQIKRELALILRSQGFDNIVEAIGTDHHK